MPSSLPNLVYYIAEGIHKNTDMMIKNVKLVELNTKLVCMCCAFLAMISINALRG